MSVYEAPYLAIYFSVLAFILGACLGSFLNCAAWRIAHGKPWTKGRSACPSCGHALSALDLFPLASWVFLGGKCRYCKEKISARYPLTELFFAALSVACLLRFDLSVTCLRNYIFLCCLFLLSLVDLESFTIPDGALVVSALAWLAAAFFAPDTWRTLLHGLIVGAAFGAIMLLLSLLLDKVFKKDTLGGGDIKLFAVTGLYLGAIGSLFMLLLACILGLLFAALQRAAQKNGEGGQIPFGPAISAATCVMLFFGDALTGWYLSLMG